ncbi:YpdA family putative bacillithiol disulfide reductase [Flexithrix dorotheae]|uniref:YpdA family putative bacillithiol disulfide reductase n=1 Tax=Flexithrix dorotheae TaxID=70993 RepID=UPI0003708627|nr:YpdA family putative bacillithiol disulfide reductase [Flexithrix dorotheae]
MNKERILDVLVIGGGPIGMACGIEAKKANLDYKIIEKGCLVNSLYNYPANMTFFSTSELLEIGGVPFISHYNKPTRSEALEYFRRVLNKWELDMNFYEKVLNVQKTQHGNFKVETSKGSYLTHSVVIATGFYDIPNKMNVKGEDLPKVKHYYGEPHPYAGQKVVVVGAANSAVDAALETYRKGADVSIIIRGEEISHRVKYWIKPDIENRIKEGSIKAYFKSTLEWISEDEVAINTPEGLKVIANDFVLALTGYMPDFDFLKKSGITLSDDNLLTPTHSKETYETNVENLYLAGVVCGGMKTSTWFIENSREHATLVINDISKKLNKTLA